MTSFVLKPRHRVVGQTNDAFPRVLARWQALPIKVLERRRLFSRERQNRYNRSRSRHQIVAWSYAKTIA
jgi:hypothetical protein